MLPVLDGFGVCQRIGKQSQVPIVMLSGRSDVLERGTGYLFRRLVQPAL
jgi:DNA-binding response OmpR family regulator